VAPLALSVDEPPVHIDEVVEEAVTVGVTLTVTDTVCGALVHPPVVPVIV
jgi:hypothetical protein